MLKFIKKRWIIVVVLTLLLCGVVVYFKISSANTTTIKTITVKHETLNDTISFSGKIDAEENVLLRFQTSGYLNWVGVKKGDYVKKYQTLASLDKRSVQKTLEKYLIAYKKDRNTFDQTNDTYKNQVFNDAIKRTIEDSQVDLNSSVLDVELQNLALEFSNLWTPIDGLVVSVDSPLAGVNITPSQASFEVINPKTIYFSATADQSDVVKLIASQSAQIILDSYPDQEINSAITEISFVPKTGETGTVYEIKLALPVDNSDYKYRMGMTGDANFTLRSLSNVIALDTKIIKSNPDKTKYVWVKENNNKVKRIVTLGEVFDNQTQITSGLNDGDKVFEN